MPLENEAEVIERIRQILGADEKIFDLHGVASMVNARVLGAHVAPGRARFLPLLPDVMSDPYEIWLGFLRQPATGRVVLRARAIKAFQLASGQGVLAVMDAQNGMLVGWTFVPPGNIRYLQSQRWGWLLYDR